MDGRVEYGKIRKPTSSYILRWLIILFLFLRGVAQPGSALAWGVRCRRFKSSRPDHLSLSYG